jgi:hypothetical protein
MRRPSRPARRLRIGRLDLDLRGIAPATAEASARALGPALASTLAHSRDLGFGMLDSEVAVDRIDAGRIDSSASPEAHDLAVRIAQRIAQALEPEGQ